MPNDVKRYVAIGGMVPVEYGEGSGVFVSALDHDRIVSALNEAGRRLQALVDQLEHYLEQTERLRKDAERYRWMVDNGYFRCVSGSIPAKAPTLDEAIDAALKASR